MSVACGSAGKGEDLKKYSKETVIVENASLCDGEPADRYGMM